MMWGVYSRGADFKLHLEIDIEGFDLNEAQIAAWLKMRGYKLDGKVLKPIRGELK